MTPAVYTEDMFKTTHDAANREVVKAVIRAELNLVGLAMRAERKVIDKIVDGLKFHSCRISLTFPTRVAWTGSSRFRVCSFVTDAGMTGEMFAMRGYLGEQ